MQLLAGVLFAVGLGAAGCTMDDASMGGASAEDAAYGAGGSGNNQGGGHAGSGSGSGSGGAGGGSGGGSWGSNGSGGAGGGGNTNVSFGGAQDFGYFRRLLDQGIVPTSTDIDAAGFFAEHHTELPPPDCGERICLQAMLGVLGNLSSGQNCTMLQLGLNSPIVADETARPPLSLAVVVDVSGSMASENKLAFVRQGLELLVNELKDEDQLSLVTYSSEARVLVPLAPVAGRRNELLGVVRALQPEGGTNIHAGLELGFTQILNGWDSGRQNRVIFLSDGQATQGITSTEAILAMSRSFNSEGIGLTTIGVGTSFNRDLMKRLAEQGDGNHYFLEDAGAVTDVFTEELSYFTVPVAFDLDLEVRTGSDYSLRRAVGAPLWEDTDAGGRLSLPSVFLAHRMAHDDVTGNEGRRGGGSALLLELMPRDEDGSAPAEAQVALLDLSFREPGTDRIVQQSVEVRFPFAPWILPPRGYFDGAIVEKSFVMLNVLVALEQACDLFHQGAGAQGILILRRVIAGAADYEDSAHEGTGDVDIRLDIELMEQLAAVLQQAGAVEPEDPGASEDPWPAD